MASNSTQDNDMPVGKMANIEGTNALDPDGTAGGANINQSGNIVGGGVGRRETPGQTGVYPISADQGANPDAPIQGQASWGQGDRGAAGYQDSGTSQVLTTDQIDSSAGDQSAEQQTGNVDIPGQA